jgi:hypothetical protein
MIRPITHIAQTNRSDAFVESSFIKFKGINSFNIFSKIFDQKIIITHLNITCTMGDFKVGWLETTKLPDEQE